jgi:hypothetical protein
MSGRGGLKLDYAFQERPSLSEEPSVEVVAALSVCRGRQREFGLRIFVQCTGIGVERLANALEVLMRNAGVSCTPCQYCRVYGVLT